MFKLEVPHKCLLERIRDLADHEDRGKCCIAYQYLMNCPSSSYSHYIALREQIIDNDEKLNCFDFQSTFGIECALWLNIHSFTNWCESTFCGKETRISSKIDFSTKLFSEILDYALHFDLLQWQYDTALYKVVSSAINTAGFSKCSPAPALDTKAVFPDLLAMAAQVCA